MDFSGYISYRYLEMLCEMPPSDDPKQCDLFFIRAHFGANPGRIFRKIPGNIQVFKDKILLIFFKVLKFFIFQILESS